MDCVSSSFWVGVVAVVVILGGQVLGFLPSWSENHDEK